MECSSARTRPRRSRTISPDCALTPWRAPEALAAAGTMKDGGRAVLILGGPSPLAKTPEERGKANTGKAKRNFYAALYGAYNVVDHFTVSGDL